MKIMHYSNHELLYAYEALEPVIDTQTVHLHHDAHHLGYIKKLNAALDSVNYPKMPLVELLKHLDQVPESVYRVVRDNAGGFYNHNLYWDILSPEGHSLSPEFGQVLNKYFGGLEGFQAACISKSMAWVGSGWTWLYVDARGELHVDVTDKHDNPLMKECPFHGIPIFVIDLWEHAYYLKYKNDKKSYFEAIWSLVSWKHVEQRYQEAIKTQK